MESLEQKQLLTTVGFTGDYAIGNWSDTGILDGTTSIASGTDPTMEAIFGYNVDLSDMGQGVSQRSADFLVPSNVTGSVTLDYSFNGNHNYHQAAAFLDSVVGGTATNMLASSTFGGFSFSGSATIVAQQGQSFGFRVGGENIDSISTLVGNLTVTNFVAHDSIVVDSTSDIDDGDFSPGNLTLREAIGLANTISGADTITFDPTVFTGGANSLIRLDGTELVIGETLTIDGTTGTDVLITADKDDDDVTIGTTEITDAANNTNTSDNSLIFFISSGDTTLRGLTLTGGVNDTDFEGGGGIRSISSGTLTLDHSILIGNAATGNFADGGGIHTDSGSVFLTGSTVSGNTSPSDGGGIYTDSGSVSLTGSTVSGNTSGEDGGGIFAFSGPVTLTSSTVSGNTSTRDGGGIYSFSGSVSLTGSTVSGNTTTDEEGGGIRSFTGSVFLTGSTVSGNTSGDDGGGISTSSGDVTLTSSTVSGNTSTHDGGGISTSSGDVTLTSSTVSGNTSSDDGGGIFTFSGSVSLTISTVSGCTSGDDGGGIFAFYGAVTLTSSTVSGNEAESVGGGIFVFDTSDNPSLSIENSIVAGNTDNGTAPDLQPDPGSTLTINHSLIGATGLTITGTGNQVGTLASPINTLLGPLTDNGGPTQTHALLPGSPALDAGNSSLTTDQRGFTRPIDNPSLANATGGNGADIGAFEQQTEFSSLVVTTNSDVVDDTDFVTSLREAINFASTNPGADTVTFDSALTASGDATIGLSMFDTGQDGGPPATSEFGPTAFIIRAEAGGNNDLTIEGPSGENGITIQRDNNAADFRLFHVQKDQSLTLTNLTLTGGSAKGNASSDGAGGASAGMGGLAFNQGTLAIRNSTMTGNTATGGESERNSLYGNGAGVASNGGPNSGTAPIGNGGFGGGGVEVYGNENGGHGGFGGGGASGALHETSPANGVGGHGGFGGGAGIGGQSLTSSSSGPNGTPGFGGGNANDGVPAVGGAGAGMGGAVFNAGGNLIITNSTVSGNAASGGVSDEGISSVEASGMGAGVFSRNGNVNITNSTFANNTVATGNASGAAIFLVADGSANGADDMGTGIVVQIDNTILADSFGGSDAAFVSLNAGTSTVAGSGNIVEVNDLGAQLTIGVVGINVDAMLASLADNGGPTMTHALLSGSAALDAGNSTLATDQRGFTRPVDSPNIVNATGGNGSDIGAFEQQTEFPSLVVTTAADVVDDADFLTSLREAIATANNDPGADTITFAGGLGEAFENGGTILLDGTELAITDTLTIDASAIPANVTVDAQANSRVIFIESGDVTIRGLTITGGQSDEPGGGVRADSSGVLTLNESSVTGNTSTGHGGGIYTYGAAVIVNGSSITGNSSGQYGGGIISLTNTVSVTNSTVNQNISTGSGGGIVASLGAVTITDSSVSGNSAGLAGGGIVTLYSGAVATVTNSTISGNSSGLSGAGIFALSAAVTLNNSTLSGNDAGGDYGGAIYANFGSVSIDHSTVTSNSSTTNGGGIFSQGTTTFNNSIIAGNVAPGAASDFVGTGSNLSGSFNLLGKGDALSSGNNNITNSLDAGLAPLADNGGPTLTHALLPGSSALNAGDPFPVLLPTFDQRGSGFDRVSNNRLDIGAFELQPVTPSCDFDGDFDCDIDDIDAMIMEIAAGTNNVAFDMTGDGNVNLSDRDQWLADAGALNLASGNAYLLGDANLDGTVDGTDFMIWSANKFRSTGKWSQGDWNADGNTDGQDFLIWNANKFQTSDAPEVGSISLHRLHDVALSGLFANADRDEDESKGDSDEPKTFDAAFAAF